MKKLRLFILTLLAGTSSLWARPLLTEEVKPIGFLNFEGGTTFSYRRDSFGNPVNTYETVNFPVQIKFGVHRKADAGINVSYLFHKLKMPNGELSGTSSANIIPNFKYSPYEYFGVKFLWHMAQSETTSDELPVARGDDFEFIQMFKIPVSFGAMHLNTGYLWRDTYQSRLGARTALKHKIEPGNIFESRASWEIPALWNINLLSELAYYAVSQEKLDGQSIPNSSGDALDVLLGLTWIYEGWNIGAGMAFGLGSENHTSFNLERGAGDWQGLFHLSYKISPQRPN